MNLPIETFLDTAKVDELDQSFFSSMNNGQYSLLRDHIDMNEFIESGYITYIADSITNGDDITKSVIKRNIISKYFDGNSKVRIVKKEEVNQDLKCQSESNLFSLKIMDNQKISVSPLPFWTIQQFPNDWKKLSKHNEYFAGGNNPTFLSWRALNVNHFDIKSIILIDRYFLNFLNLAIINLEKILDGLIHNQRRSGKLNFSIITKENPKFAGNKEYIHNTQKRIIDKLKDKFPCLSLSIHYAPEVYFHDRYILTDFYYITAGSGFTLHNILKLKVTKASNLISHHSVSTRKAYGVYKKTLADIHDLFKKNIVTQSSGEIDNRLFRVLRRE